MITHRHRRSDRWQFRAPWQHEGPLVVDAPHPLAPNRAYLPSMQADLVTGQPYNSTVTGVGVTPYSDVSAIGPCVRYGSGSYHNVGSGPYLGGLGAWSIFAIVSGIFGNTLNGSAVYSERNAASGNDLIKLLICTPGSTNSASVVYRNDAGTLINPTTTVGPSILDGKPHSMAAVFTGANAFSFTDGQLSSQTSWGGANNNFTDAGIGRLLGNDIQDTTNSALVGQIICVYLYKRALMQAEVVRLTADPFSVLMPRAPKISSSVTGASGGAFIIHPFV